VRATHNAKKGAKNQTGQDFEIDILYYFEKLAPENAQGQGNYHFCSCGPVYNHLLDHHIAKDAVQALSTRQSGFST
jgi:hypothetical protein